MFALMYYDYDNTDCHGIFSTIPLAVAARTVCRASQSYGPHHNNWYIVPVTLDVTKSSGVGHDPDYWRIPQP